MNTPEIRQTALTPLQRAKEHDLHVRAFEKHWSDWVDIAKTCIQVDTDREWELLGFRSFGQWMQDAAPRSRAYLYLVIGRYRELVPDIPEEELQAISLGSAGLLKQVSSKIRQDPEIREAARKKPSDLRRTIKERHPSQHIEGLDVRTLRFTESQALIFDEMVEAYRAQNNHEATAEEAVESVCANWLDSSFDGESQGVISNRERAAQITASGM